MKEQVKQPYYLCVFVPEFPAQARLRLRPELAGSAVVVLAGEPPFEQVCSLNAPAGKLGLVHGMTRAELESFTGVHILRRSPVEERAAHAALLQAAGVFTPRVEVQPLPGPVFAMVLDVTGTDRIFGSPLQACKRLEQSILALRIRAQYAGSANVRVAVCMAPSAGKAPVLVVAGQEQASLKALPLAVLNPSPQQAETFALWGLHTVGELAALAEVEVVARLGQEGKRLLLLAQGRHPHLMVPEEPAFALAELRTLDSPIELLDSLLFLLGPMLDQLLARAQDRAYALASVTVKLGTEGGGEHTRTVRPALPVVEREVLLKLIHLDLQAHPPAAGILSVALSAEPGDRSKVQLGLFAPQLPEPMRLEVTLARLGALVGEGRVGRARLLDSHRPDSFVMEKFQVPAPQPPVETTKAEVEPAFATTALRRCRPPVPVIVRRQGDRPIGFTWNGKRYEVQNSSGPWRRSGDWWSGSVWSQEDWDVRASATGASSAGSSAAGSLPADFSVTGFPLKDSPLNDASPDRSSGSGSQDVLLCILSCDLLHAQWHMEALYD